MASRILGDDFLWISCVSADILLVMCVTLNWVVTHLVLTQINITRSYVCLRFYLYDPLGLGNAFVSQPGILPNGLEKEPQTAAPATTPSTASTDLTKADLDKLPQDQVRRIYNARFHTNMPAKTTATKDAIIANYVARSHAAPRPPTAPKPQTPKVLTTTQYTIV